MRIRWCVYGEAWLGNINHGTKRQHPPPPLSPLPSVSTPRWARQLVVDGEERIEITSISQMCEEVDALVDCMDSYMECQRERRLEKLRGLGWMRRRWYYVFAVPIALTGAVMVGQRWGEIKSGEVEGLCHKAGLGLRSSLVPTLNLSPPPPSPLPLTPRPVSCQSLRQGSSEDDVLLR